MLIAEDLLLLLTDDETGRLQTGGDEADVALGGAVLIELALMGRVDVAGPDEEARHGRVVVRNAAPTSQPELDTALETVTTKEGKKPQAVVRALGKGVRRRLYDDLVARGLLSADTDKVLGIFPRHRWPAHDASHEEAVRRDLVAALRTGRAEDARVAALVSLLHALEVEPRVIDAELAGMTKKELLANARRIADGDWASAAVRRAIDEMHAAVIAAITAGTVASGTV